MSAADLRPLILLVDDTPENLDILRGILKDEYRIKVAINGQRALEIAAGGEPPSLVLLDVMMPDMDGLEVCRRLKAEVATRHIPVIFVTSLSDSQDEEAGFKAGGVDYITKPFSPSTVLSRVHTHITLLNQARALARLARAEMQKAKAASAPIVPAGSDHPLAEALLANLAILAGAAGRDEIAQIAQELQRIHQRGGDTGPWLARLESAVKLAGGGQPAPARPASTAAPAYVAAGQGDSLDRAQLSALMGGILAAIQDGDDQCEKEVRTMLRLLAGTSHVIDCEKVLFAIRNYRFPEAREHLTKLARDAGIQVEA